MPNQKNDDRSSNQKGNMTNPPGKQDQQNKQGGQQGNRRGDMGNQDRDKNRGSQQGDQGNMPGRGQEDQKERVSSDRAYDEDVDMQESERRNMNEDSE